MGLLIIYIVLVVVGEFAAVNLGLYLDTVAPTLSLLIALGLFFSVLVVAWPIAVLVHGKMFPAEKAA